MPTNKQLEFLDDAEKLFVESGLETITIEKVLKSSVSRRTLDNWKALYNWEQKRLNYKSRIGGVKDNVLNLLDQSAVTAQTEPSVKNIKAFKEMVLLAMKLGVDLGITNDEDGVKTPASEKTAEAIRKLLRLPGK